MLQLIYSKVHIITTRALYSLSHSLTHSLTHSSPLQYPLDAVGKDLVGVLLRLSSQQIVPHAFVNFDLLVFGW